mmetsp:Transcript_1426/g.5246  ORF Transcript_1426/g.5246 Transcript_1426/m.5246 type:complete len:430 (+) Transcript_1426:607-1896(+)
MLPQELLVLVQQQRRRLVLERVLHRVLEPGVHGCELALELLLRLGHRHLSRADARLDRSGAQTGCARRGCAPQAPNLDAVATAASVIRVVVVAVVSSGGACGCFPSLSGIGGCARTRGGSFTCFRRGRLCASTGAASVATPRAENERSRGVAHEHDELAQDVPCGVLYRVAARSSVGGGCVCCRRRRTIRCSSVASSSCDCHSSGGTCRSSGGTCRSSSCGGGSVGSRGERPGKKRGSHRCDGFRAVPRAVPAADHADGREVERAVGAGTSGVDIGSGVGVVFVVVRIGGVVGGNGCSVGGSSRDSKATRGASTNASASALARGDDTVTECSERSAGRHQRLRPRQRWRRKWKLRWLLPPLLLPWLLLQRRLEWCHAGADVPGRGEGGWHRCGECGSRHGAHDAGEPSGAAAAGAPSAAGAPASRPSPA